MKKKQQSKILVLISIIMSLAVIGVAGYNYIKTLKHNTDIDSVEVTKDDAYSIRKNATSYQKSIYDELSEALKEEPVQDNKIAGLVAQNFIADFYTWTNKFRLNDIGGLQFVYEPIRDNVYHNAQDSTYKDLYYYLNNGGLKNTLEVEKVEITGSRPLDIFLHDTKGKEEQTDPKTNKPVKGTTNKAVQVDVKWTYKGTTTFDTTVYESDAKITLIKNGKGHYMIVEVAEYDA